MLSILSLKFCCKDILSIQLSVYYFHYGGMGLIISPEICKEEYENSRAISKETTNKVMYNKIQFQDNRV